MGLRHRAALGISEVTDVLVLVVSEQTGQISVVQNGKISTNLMLSEVRQRINLYISATLEAQEDIEKKPVSEEIPPPQAIKH
jgi:DNA integrity scanning protein DisA with diadenylate cyclase activity